MTLTELQKEIIKLLKSGKFGYTSEELIYLTKACEDTIIEELEQMEEMGIIIRDKHYIPNKYRLLQNISDRKPKLSEMTINVF